MRWSVALLVGCSKTDPIDADVTESDLVPNVQHVRWSIDTPGTSHARYGLVGGPLDQRTPSTKATKVDLAVMGLKSGASYALQAVTVTDEGDELVSDELRVDVPAAPDATSTTLITRVDGAMDLGRYVIVLIRIADQASIASIFDRDGDVVWWREVISATRDAHTARISADGSELLYGFYDQTADDTLGGVYGIPFDGMGEESFTKTPFAHHDFRELSDGSLAWIGLRYLDDQRIDGEPIDIVSDTILEAPRDAGPDVEPTLVFDYIDDSGIELFHVCSHMAEDFNDTPYRQWTHSNSLMLDPVEPDRYYWVLSRYQDALIKVDRDSGERVEQIGGVYATVDQVGGAWSHPHMQQMWDGGFVIFNNNTHPEGPSTSQEWSFDGETATLVHEFAGRAKVGGMADAIKLRNGNVLTAWSSDRRLEERTVADEVVWSLGFDLNVTSGRLTVIDDLYAPVPAAFGLP